MWKCWKERRDKTEIYFKKDNNHLQRRKNRPGFILQRGNKPRRDDKKETR